MPVEILAPAGGEKSFYAAVSSGANAIYLGLKEFSARKNAENFSVENLGYFIKYAHFFGVKIYVAVNTLVKDDEIDGFIKIVTDAYKLGADAFIMQDMFLGKLLKEKIPDICLHLSTQAGVCNEQGAKAAVEYGFSRVILARETATEDVKKITRIIETEVFIHGALCTCFSGHCYMSSFAGGLSGNRGFCKQPCRKKYTYGGSGITSFTGYNLSLADLCLKNEIQRLIEAGVKSFKIEGRMRSPEYVYSAVSVYRAAADGKNDASAFKQLKRAFNRGDFTTGYFTGNTRGIISNKTQANIGDFIGKVNRVEGKRVFVATSEKFNVKDGFKVLRGECEAGSLKYVGSAGGEAVFDSFGGISAGDSVRITKDESFAAEVLSMVKTKKINVELNFEGNCKASAVISSENRSVSVESDEIFFPAQSRALTENEAIECFRKVDGYPFDPEIKVNKIEKVFAPKSVINAFRRKCYSVFFDCFSGERNVVSGLISLSSQLFTPNVNSHKIAVISSDFSFDLSSVDIAVFRPLDYTDENELNDFLAKTNMLERYLYVPPFASGEDVKILMRALKGFDGVYAEGYYGAELAKEAGVKLFAGTGFNLFNRFDLKRVQEISDYFVYSKELSLTETGRISSSGFTFSLGCIQVMDLIYCPFSEKCADCKRGNIFSLTDEDNRTFTVRRYKLSRCRFEVYNPYSLVADKCVEKRLLYDFTLYSSNQCNEILHADNILKIKGIIPNHTSGNLVRGVK
ncbi:MAG: U32 family peptidase [Clostridia bacterium]|nr:U32 family peptidase [Clostridia bacterium]